MPKSLETGIVQVRNPINSTYSTISYCAIRSPYLVDRAALSCSERVGGKKTLQDFPMKRILTCPRSEASRYRRRDSPFLEL